MLWAVPSQCPSQYMAPAAVGAQGSAPDKSQNTCDGVLLPVPVPSLLSAPGNLFQWFNQILGVFPCKRGVPGSSRKVYLSWGIFSAGAAVHPNMAVPEFGGKLGLFPFVQSTFGPRSIGCCEGGATKALLEVGVFPEGSGSSHGAFITKTSQIPLIQALIKLLPCFSFVFKLRILVGLSHLRILQHSFPQGLIFIPNPSSK